MDVITINGLEKEFGSKRVLDKIVLQIAQGEILGLLGPSGAGKTTLIKILTGQLKASGGKAYLFGTDCAALTPEIYGKIGMVLDNSGLYERLSSYDNLLLFTRIFGVPKDRIKPALEKVELADAMKTRVEKLSKGMRQRLVLARAILHSPQLLFLDEPTGGLDPATTLSIHELLGELKKQGTTIFLTTHNMEEASKMCDNVALLNEGRILEYGNPEEICRIHNQQNTISLLLHDGENITLPNIPESSARIAQYFHNGMVRSIHSSEPDLESVFIELTGRGLI